ncbi:MAG: hypothetical protein UW07_C0026G0011 [Candidatus Nomurabacteria bacterium GW2011_GWF2_43_8]|uniref:Uncharacterized protein n=1 Tax=Candidatus Nomurabacteria bacterium GW2011_GWF2_43_8 TaxID=1618779 RepID=A0A0G1FMN2_9BACT|nr:MAG: hypothetical protein UW07_C0026G0011 [Candidatus Nomurabacteria bacterium GW2011_GWF2_43_8]
MITGTRSQLRKREARPAPGTPDAAAREAADVHVETTTAVEKHAGHESTPHPEEGGVTILPELALMVANELANLGLCELPRGLSEDLGEVAVHDLLVDSGPDLRSWDGLTNRQGLAVDSAREQPRGCKRLGAISGTDDDGLRLVQTAEINPDSRAVNDGLQNIRDFPGVADSVHDHFADRGPQLE